MFSKISKFFGSIGTFFGTVFNTVVKNFFPRTVFHRTQMVNFNLLGTVYIIVSLLGSIFITGKIEVLALVAVYLMWMLFLGLFKFIRKGDRLELSDNCIMIAAMNLVLIQSLPMWFFLGSLWYLLVSFMAMVSTMKLFDGMDLSDSKYDTIELAWEYECIDDDTNDEPTPAQEAQEAPVK